MRLFFFFLPKEGNEFYPFSKNFIQRALLSIKNISFTDPLAEIKGGSVMHKDKMIRKQQASWKQNSHPTAALREPLPTTSSPLCLTNCFCCGSRNQGDGIRTEIQWDKSPTGWKTQGSAWCQRSAVTRRVRGRCLGCGGLCAAHAKHFKGREEGLVMNDPIVQRGLGACSILCSAL